MLIYTNQRSRKRNPTAKQRELQAEWQELVNRTKSHFSADKKVNNTHFSAPKPFVRETEYIPSKDTGYYNTFKKADLYYTGDKMKGIGTLHKSNAVPIFTDEEAKDQANMRR
jgi:SRSO17 transposase